jgi:hypothetical protein
MFEERDPKMSDNVATKGKFRPKVDEVIER